MDPIDYLTHPRAREAMAGAKLYAKKATTGLRLVHPEEVGSIQVTWKSDPGDPRGFSEESRQAIQADWILARNSHAPLGVAPDGSVLFNEWKIERHVALDNYGVDAISSLGFQFTEHRKCALLRAAQISPETLDMFGASAGEPLPIKVSWSQTPMMAGVGDFITDQGYAISKANMLDYEEAMEARQPRPFF